MNLLPLPGIAFSGKAGSGKTFLADAVVRSFPSPARVVSFATPLKNEVYALYGLRKGDPGAREAMIAHGQERRAECPTYWIDRCAEELDDSLMSGLTPVVDDLRFLNEMSFLRGREMFVVRVDASLRDRQERFRVRGQDDSICSSMDVSERELDGAEFDCRVFNWQTPPHALVARVVREAVGARALEALAA